MAALLVTFSAMGRLAREFVLLLKKPDTRALILWMIGLLLVGTIFYHMVEGWSWLDALYFCVITLSTIGFGDLSPIVPVSKIFTIIFIFLGLSIFVSLVNMLAKARRELYSERAAKVHQGLSANDGTHGGSSNQPDPGNGHS